MNRKFVVSVFFFLCAVIFNLTAQTTTIDSLDNLLQKHIAKDTIRANLLNEIANELASINNNQALSFAKEANELANEIGYLKGEAMSFKLLGVYYYEKSNYEEAFKNYQEASEAYNKLENNARLVNCLNNMGRIRQKQGRYPEALEFHQKALSISEASGDKKNISTSLNAIGIIHGRQGDYAKALEYYNKTLEISKELGNIKGISTCMNNIGVIHSKQGNDSMALEYYKKVVKYQEDIGNNRSISKVLNNIGSILSRQGKFDEALKYYQKSLKLFVDRKNPSGICYTNRCIGAVYLKSNNIEKALYYTNLSLKIADENNLMEKSKNIYRQLSKIYVKTGEYKRAYNCYLEYISLKDSIFNEKNVKKLTSLENKYEFEKEKQALELEQQKKDAIQAEEVKQQKTVRNFSIIGFVLMALLAIVVLRSFLQKRKANHRLAEQKEEIQTQAEELQIVNNKLQELDKFKEEMTGMIVHDLKNPLNSIIGLSDNAIVKQSGKQMLNMIMNMLDVQKHEDVEIHLKSSNISISEASKSALHQVNLLCEEKSIVLINQIQNHFVRAEREIIERVFVNILTNAIKYTPNNGTIFLNSFINSSGLIQVSIIDSGEGIPKDKLDTVFGKFEQVIAKKSGMARSTGIGLTFCKIFVEAHGGEIGVGSEVGKGTTFWFTLPTGGNGKKERVINEGIVIEKSFDLTQSDKNILKPFLRELQKLEVYESTDVEEILEQIDFTKTENLSKWKKEMDNALYGVNQEKYMNLVMMINEKK